MLADATCSICLESISILPSKKLLCYHVFHEKCIDEWTKQQNNCPLCRREIAKKKADVVIDDEKISIDEMVSDAMFEIDAEFLRPEMEYSGMDDPIDFKDEVVQSEDRLDESYALAGNVFILPNRRHVPWRVNSPKPTRMPKSRGFMTEGDYQS